ncbi:TPA: hypothetical protein NHR34_005078 [Pseudomonas aeruginosa]|nr:hypothetical protein [Pseudomonas aeruginosa]
MKGLEGRPLVGVRMASIPPAKNTDFDPEIAFRIRFKTASAEESSP